ncbi:hypothetical protein [Thiocapsa sp.]|uniref:hypothetical protein n=1 Tax=Thiocapsa sp. TaxID=2024551 RepID=UPI002C1C8EA2|nr:hypothetical protein [Thiocapsa sp.]HSO84185.1 hypothetical protein [Thiocapsa sp.]
MRIFSPLTKLIVILAVCPSFVAAEGLWNGIKAGAGNAFERGRSLSLDALATGADLAAKGMDRTRRATEDASAFLLREGTPEEQRAFVDGLAFGTLDRLFSTDPEIHALFDRSFGWAVFTVRQIAVGATAGYGYGLAMRRDETDRIYMKMATGGVGFSYGMGGFASELVILFEDEAAFSRFVELGFEVSAEARGSVSGEGGDVTKPFSRGVSVYRVTESGMRLEATLFGTRFWPDEALNAPDPVGND